MKSIRIKMTPDEVKGFCILQTNILNWLRSQRSDHTYVMSMIMEEYYEGLYKKLPYINRDVTISIGMAVMPVFIIGITKIEEALMPYERMIASEVMTAISKGVAADKHCREKFSMDNKQLNIF